MLQIHDRFVERGLRKGDKCGHHVPKTALMVTKDMTQLNLPRERITAIRRTSIRTQVVVVVD